MKEAKMMSFARGQVHSQIVGRCFLLLATSPNQTPFPIFMFSNQFLTLDYLQPLLIMKYNDEQELCALTRIKSPAK